MGCLAVLKSMAKAALPMAQQAVSAALPTQGSLKNRLKAVAHTAATKKKSSEAWPCGCKNNPVSLLLDAPALIQWDYLRKAIETQLPQLTVLWVVPPTQTDVIRTYHELIEAKGDLEHTNELDLKPGLNVTLSTSLTAT